jgi:N,N'-diacetyllegionaminate synthase
MKSEKVLIIAEAGVNHNGDLDKAFKLIDVAVEAQADIVKFQTFKAETLVTKTAQMAVYQKENLQTDAVQFKMLKELELQWKDHEKLIEHCKKSGIKFLSTGFDIESLKFLATLNMGIWKIPSGEITNLPYLEFLAEQSGEIIISTGMCDMNDIKSSLKIFESKGVQKNRITVLHCNTDYPTRYSDVHLNAMKSIKEACQVKVGYSDHTMGIEVSVAAVALGATLIEKHFTLDRNLPGPDHKASLEPHELKQMVSSIRNIEQALGRSEKLPTERELLNRVVARKSIVAKKPIAKGAVFTYENLTTKRPGTGISPMKWHEVLGTIAQKDYEADDLI